MLVGVMLLQQGMGYLHAKGIIHKDLKSKNVFLESGNQTAKVIITDFGLFNVTKLCQGSRSEFIFLYCLMLMESNNWFAVTNRRGISRMSAKQYAPKCPH